MKKGKSVIKFILSLVLVIGSACSNFHSGNGSIIIAGSDTMYYLTIGLASEYMKQNPETTIHVKGGGSSTGFDALQEGSADICMSSRNIHSDEVMTLASKYSAIGMSNLIAKDALSIFVNNSNPVDDLSLKQIKDLFTCKYANWKYVGGPDDTVVTVIRTPQSGTFDYFKSHVLDGDDFCSNALSINTTQSITNFIINNKNSIGFGGIGYQKGIKLLKINGIAPTEINVRNDSYPIIRYLFFFTVKSPRGEVKKFIDWVMSPQGQRIVAESGYFSIWD